MAKKRRKRALNKLDGLSEQITKHLQKIEGDPTCRAVRHWKAEVCEWIQQAESLLDDVGKRTADQLRDKINGWKEQLEP